MWRILFGEVSTGRLGRVAFLGYSILLGMLVIAVGIGIGAAIGVAETVIGGDLQLAQELLAEHFTGLFVVGMTVFGIVVVFVNFNLTAKRLRDIGLPGWLSVAGIVLLTMSVSLVFSQQAGGTANTICFLALLLLPGGLIGQNSD